jgi:hypothetical protein
MSDPQSSIQLPKNNKVNRYYYRNREVILEKKRLARLAKKGVDISVVSSNTLSAEERRQRIMEHLKAPVAPSGVEKVPTTTAAT